MFCIDFTVAGKLRTIRLPDVHLAVAMLAELRKLEAVSDITTRYEPLLSAEDW